MREIYSAQARTVQILFFLFLINLLKIYMPISLAARKSYEWKFSSISAALNASNFVRCKANELPAQTSNVTYNTYVYKTMHNTEENM